MNSQEPVLCRAKREILGDGTRSLRGGRRPGNLERRAAGREYSCASRRANGKENWENSLPQTLDKLRSCSTASMTALCDRNHACPMDGQAQTRDSVLSA